MPCKTCVELLDRYQESIRLYTISVATLRAPADYARAYEATERAHQACQDARDKLMEHWLSLHQDIVETVSR